jgi:polyferredoxin
LLSGSIIILVFLLLLTFLFGRIYCSVICPLGVLQDFLAKLNRGKKKRNNKRKREYRYTKPYNILRYSLLGLCIIFLIFGNITLLGWLDPYSNFGRIAVNIFRPVLVAGNNLIAWIAMQMHSYGFYHLTLHTVTLASFCFAFAALILVAILSVWRGRLFCNSLCPVGSFLSLISRFSLFRVKVDESKCTHCGLCAKSCKAECIDSKKGEIDHSRCVVCFNCLERCNKEHALHYTFAYSKPKSQSAPALEQVKGMDRRAFLATSTALAATVPLLPAWAQSKKAIDPTKLTPITPPGSRSLKHFTERCTACHLCVTHCPMQILKPAGFNFGLEYAFKPHLVYYEMAFCNYECTMCSHICPNGAIEKLTQDEKQTTQIGIAQFEKSRCVVFVENTSCGACSEHCPVQAVRMEPYGDTGLTLPHVYDELCIGCGGCESICPVRPVKAINVLANETHQTAIRPKEDKIEEVEELDFGF